MSAIEYYRHELYRIAWRMQYRAKRDFKREVPLASSPEPRTPSFSEQADNRLLVQHYLDGLTSEVGKKVICAIYLGDQTEAEVARQLNISQQAVNKWRKKMIQELSRKMNS